MGTVRAPFLFLLLAVVLATVPVLSGAQLRSSPREGLPAPLVTIGDGVTTGGDFVGSNEVPFQQALAALPGGGTILVSGQFTFGLFVAITTPGIRIVGHDAVLRSSPVGIFMVLADKISLHGLQISANAPSGPAPLITCFASDFLVEACTFVGGPTGALQPAFLQLVGGNDRWVRGNRFLPSGAWTCVLAQNGSGLHVVENSINGIGTPAYLQMDYALHGLDERRGFFSGNVVERVEEVKAVARLVNTTGERHHFVLSGNLVHTLRGDRVFDLEGSRFDLVQGNGIGRLTLDEAVVDIYSSPWGTPFTTTITGNDFHNVGTAPAIRQAGGTNLVVTGNQFSIVDATSILLVNANRCHVSTNQFVASTLAGIFPVVDVRGGDAHAILCNTFYDFPGRVLAISTNDPCSHLVANNFKWPRGGGQPQAPLRDPGSDGS